LPASPTTVGILGDSPNGVVGPLRAGRFDRFQEQVGWLEAVRAGEYLAGHAACHALMNGVDRVVFAGLGEAATPEEVGQAVHRLRDLGPLDLVVAPGLVEPSLARTLAEAVRAGGSRLWLDAPPGADVEAVLTHAAAVADGDHVRVVSPRVPTITPGRRQLEPLPATCLVAPLHLGTRPRLRGVHECPAPPGPDARRALEEAGCGLLEAVGRRRLVRLAFPAPLCHREDTPAPSGPEARLEALLRDACALCLDGGPSNPTLWRRLERAVTSRLEELRRRGEVTAYVVRCDEETCGGVGGSPVVEVVVRLPSRVREVVVRVGSTAG